MAFRLNIFLSISVAIIVEHFVVHCVDKIQVEDDNGPDIQESSRKTEDDRIEGKIQGSISDFQRYLRLFEHNRAIQVDAVKSILQSKIKVEAKYKVVEAMLTKVIQIIGEAKNNLTGWGFVPGDDWPTDENVKESVSKVLENTALFADILLHLPDMTHQLYDTNKQWEFLIGWATWFAMESRAFTGPHEKLLNLMAQEIGLIPKEDNYFNPYKAVEMERYQDESTIDVAMEEKLKHLKKTKKLKEKSKEVKDKRKGPRLSGTSHTEL
ncbi:coiled-coil domain-containing protein 134-like isoform X1 [Dreissena polymorpha]|uniref:Coiled-coil domain-containing protein 134 n=2 Tax=Dreissena polymorpha TaxID=45954 RepID=A0A9D4R5R5_DREPO|nr:coiled-coil domain-containing protein 134-like isoform X1 [Dreissena polymorpha]KAH3855268.1 hypothetical protein DPMN_097833 [Dreissena polymorpha]